MSWTVYCPNSTCQRKLSMANAPSDRIKCPFCNQIFMVQRALAPAVSGPPSPASPFDGGVESSAPLLPRHTRENTTWPVWLIGLLIVESLISVFCGILIVAKYMGVQPRPGNNDSDLNLRASGPSNFFYKPHSADFMDDGTKSTEWSKIYAVKDRMKGVAVSFKLFDEDVPDEDVLERMGRMKLSKLFPEGRYQFQAGAARLDANLAGESAISIPVDITPVGGIEGDSVASKILVGELRICSRRGIVYWFASWGPEGSKEEQSSWDKSFVFGNGRSDWKPKASPSVLLDHDSLKVRLHKSTWKVDNNETVKQLAESRPGMLAHAEGNIVAERKSKAELTIVSLEGKNSLDRATALLLEWQKLLNGSDNEAPMVKLEQFGDEGVFYKVIINQKTESFLLLQDAGTKSRYLLIGECRFDDLPFWKTEFLKISKSIKIGQ